MNLLPRKPTGVSWYPPTSRWKAEVRCEGKLHFLGYHLAQEDAIAAVMAFREECEMPVRELLGEPFVSELHPTKNGDELVWPLRGAGTKLWWLCATCSHEWQSPVSNRTRPNEPSGCPACAARRTGDRCRLSDDTARLTVMALDLEPQEPYPGDAFAPWKCKCLRCGSIITPRYNSLQQGRRMCALCKANDRRHDPMSVEADLFIRGWILLGEYARVDRRVLARHMICGYEVKIRYKEILERGGGCPHCARSGYDATAFGYLYLIEHPGYAALKIGISNKPLQRLGKHKKNEWNTDDALVLGPFTGNLPPTVERTVISSWRDQGYGPVNHLREFDGYTETVSLDHVSWDAARRQIEEALAPS